MKDRGTKEFGRFRSLFCPVHKSELKLFLPLLLIFFFICFNYNVLRAAKDSLVITAPSSGAEIIPFMKVWAILPMALVMTLLFTRLANRYSTEKVFYIMMSIFLGFFALFTGVLYPLRDTLHPHAFADHLEQLLPLGCKGFVAIIRNWTYTTFYVMAELWGTTIMSVLFWGFANEILNVKTAKRFYVLILIGGNLSAICAGGVSTYISDFGTNWGMRMGLDPWLCSLGFLSTLIIACGLFVMGVFRWLHVTTLFHHSVSDQHAYNREQPSEFKMSLRKNFQYLTQSKYLLYIATIVVTYNICINLTEVTWKDQLLHICPNPNELNAYLGKVNMWIGAMATVIALVSGTFLRRFSWTVNALIPPLISLVAGAGFFGFLLFKNSETGLLLAGILGSTPLALGVFFGSAQQCLTRASKYTIFDATKELAFIPLSKESKLKGKAAIDGVGSRLGKSGGAIIYQALFMFFGTVSFTVPYVGVILVFVIGAWIAAVCGLGKKFNELVAHHETVVISEESPAQADKTSEVIT